MKTTKVTFALRVKSTGELVRYTRTSNEHGDCCGAERFEWVTGTWAEGQPIYEAQDIHSLGRALRQNTPWYNADYDTPMHGSVNIADLEIVKRVVVETLESFEYEIPPVLRCLASYDKPMVLMKRYACAELPDQAKTLRIFEMPGGETLESMKRFEGQDLCTQGFSQLRLFKLFEVPEDYLEELGGKPGFAAATARS